MDKTEQQIREINAERQRAIRLLEDAVEIFELTECSLGAGIIGDAIDEIREGGMDEY